MMTPSDKDNLKSQLRVMMGIHGITGVLECLIEICQEFGEGFNFAANADPWWLELSAHLSTAHDELKRLLED